MPRKSVFLLVFLLCLFAATGYAQNVDNYLEQGIKQFYLENYDEAVELLEKARTQDPKSSGAAYYLGMAYKHTTEYDKALKHLQDAVTLTPPAKGAMTEYISVLYLVGRLDEAQNRIDQAEKDQVDPAGMAYWKAMILAKKNQCEDAAAALEKAKPLDAERKQSADYALGICHYSTQQLDKAQERFKAAVVYDPTSDLAENSRRYQDIIDEARYPSRPLRVTLGLYGGYDSNIILKPRNDAFAPTTDSAAGGFFKPSLRVSFTPRFSGPWLFSALYSFNATYNQKYVHSQDSMSQTVAVMPGYNFGRASVSILASFTSYQLRTDPDLFPDGEANLKRYLDYATAGAVIKVLATQNNIVEIFLGYDKKEFYNLNLMLEANNRDAIGPRAYLSWTWFFVDNGFVSLRYAYSEDRADGVYWENKMHRLSGNANVPLLPSSVPKIFGKLYLQIAGDVTFQNYSYEQPFFDEDWTFKNEARKDWIYEASAGLNWEIMKHLGLVLQYKFIRSNSNIPVYTYDDHICTAGIEFKI